MADDGGDGLQAAVIDIPLSPTNQVPSSTMGPLGRLERLIDGQVSHYEPQYGGATGVTPAKIEVEQRDAFVSLATTARKVTDGSSDSPPWSPVEALGSLGNQLVSICDSQPRVWSGTDWRTYPGTRVLTNQLAQDVLHTSQHTIQAPDSAWLNGVTCAVWTETVNAATGAITACYVAFKADNGAWLVTPTKLYQSVSPFVITGIKVVQDGSHFWVFHTNLNTVLVGVYDTHGVLLGTGGPIALPSGTVTPGAWDIVAAPSTGGYTVLFAQPAQFAGDHGVFFQAFGWNGSAVITTSNTDATIHGAQGLGFLTNDTGNGLSYLATYLNGSPEAIWAYQITNLAQTHVYNTGVLPSPTIDTLAGYVEPSTLTVYISYSKLALGTGQTHGPANDPALRFLTSFKTTTGNVTTQLRVTQSLTQVSRAFAVDGEYYVYAYYQSGSGLNIVPTKQAYTIQAGDYMYGAPVQPLAVQAGDYTEGSTIPAASNTIVGPSVFVSTPHTAVNIVAGDFVNVTTAGSGFASLGIPAGTAILIWSFSGLSGAAGYLGSRLVIAGASVSQANGTWDVLAIDSAGRYVTPLYNSTHSNLGTPVGNFTTAGTFTLTSMTAYIVQDLAPFISTQTEQFFTFVGHVVVTGSSHGNNISSTVIQRIFYGQPGPNYFGTPGPYGAVWVTTVGQTNAIDTFTASTSPAIPDGWRFQNGEFDSTYVGTDLVVTDNAASPTNIGTFPVTSVASGTTLVTGGATSLLSQMFGFPFPTISINLTTQVPYTFFLQGLTLDYTYQGALVTLQGAANPNNNGVYQIVQIISSNTFIAQPVNGLSNQVNEAFNGAFQTITIFFAQNIQPEFQPTWFIVPITGSQPVVGRFEYGLAYADWRLEPDSTIGPDLFPGSLTSISTTTVGSQVLLPYRAQNVTAATLETTPAGEVNIVQESFVSTVGLKAFTLLNEHGKPRAGWGELSIPGPMSVVFTPSGFIEDGQGLAPEAPFLVSQAVGSAGTQALTVGGVYFVVAVLEYTDENGNRTYSPPSPALQVNMSGTNTVATYGGRSPYPISSTGGPVANTYGPTTRLSGISLYRTAFINGVPTTQHYKITDDLNINGLAPISATNPSGFSFPDAFTWNYLDQNPDAGLNANEILYTDKSLLPRYPAPAGPNGPVTWKNREWIIGYDDAVWMSGEKAEGDAIWYNPAFRFPFPAEDAPLGCSPMDDYLIVVCEASVWYIPAAQFPDATGGNGGLPTPVRLPFPNGSVNGHCETIREGVAYDSTDGGVWLVTRQLQNQWLSHDLLTTLTGVILGLAVDQGQRLFVHQFITSGTDPSLLVYDGIPQCWYEWVTPSTPKLLAVLNGQACYEDTSLVAVVTPSASADLIAGVTFGIAGPDVTAADFNLGNVRGLKKVWEFQGVGTYEGPHNINAVLAYPDDGWPTKTYSKIVPASLVPYVLPFNPNPEDASGYKIRIYPDFSGIISPGATFRLEVISAQVGLEPVGLNKLPAYLSLKQG